MKRSWRAKITTLWSASWSARRGWSARPSTVCHGEYVVLPMLADDAVATAFLLVERVKGGWPVWAVKWRSADGVRVRRRLGCGAWVVRDRSGRWRPREGRPTAGQLTEFQA